MSSRSSSPDPLALPTSHQYHRGSADPFRPSKPPVRRSTNLAHSSPTKSFVMDTGDAGDASPWRIKVTVEAEPKDVSSPSRRQMRTTKIPLKGGSSSPKKQATPKRSKGSTSNDAGDEREEDARRGQRKRKGTPIRRKSQKTATLNQTTEEMHEDGSAISRPNGSSPSKRLSTESARRRASQQPTARSTCLNRARRELDNALDAAVGYTEESENNAHLVSDAPGEMTVANEDFTMISVETLQSMKNDTSVLENTKIAEGNKSVASVSYLPSSPPMTHNGRVESQKNLVGYPDLSAPAAPPKHAHYDMMSWRPTGPAKLASLHRQDTTSNSRLPNNLDSEPSEWRRERQQVSREIENADTSQVIVIEDGTQAWPSNDEDDDDGDGDEGDIWAEEASRSLEEEQSKHQRKIGTNDGQDQSTSKLSSPKLDDLFADQPVKPLRSKIPRTWRRSSGMDFSYVDSPEHGALSARKSSGGSTDGEEAGSRGSGVLTPPGTDDETVNHYIEESDVSLTQPDAAATQLQNQPQPQQSSAAQSDTDTPGSDSSISSDGNDTGLFWQRHLHQAYRRERPRPQQQRAMELSELLALNKNSSAQSHSLPGEAEMGSTKVLLIGAKAALSGNRKKPISASSTSQQIQLPEGVQKARPQSTVRMNALGESWSNTAGSQGGQPAIQPKRTITRKPKEHKSIVEPKQMDSDMVDSFESKASDQRQLLGEMESTQKGQRQWFDDVELSCVSNNSEHEGVVGSEGSIYGAGEDGEEVEVSRSYEERLNLDSPQKIKVKFDDSGHDAELLRPRREYAPLFGAAQPSPAPQSETQSSVALVKEESASTAPTEPAHLQPSLFSRLTTTLWSAVIRPTGPTAVFPPAGADKDPPYSNSLRAHIRSRYGVLSCVHPWTMAHMRTIHRMVNSCTSNCSDSIIPKSGPLPAYLRSVIGSTQTDVCGDVRFLFTTQHAHVVHAFMQVLVSPEVVLAMETGQVELLGDSFAKEHRGMILGRHGADLVFDESHLPKRGSLIGMGFAVKAIGNVVIANIDTARREEEARRRRELKMYEDGVNNEDDRSASG